MTSQLRIGLAQINPTVGDLDGNLQLINDSLLEAVASGCQLVAFPELAITGYPPEDLLLVPRFLAEAEEKLLEIARLTNGTVAIVGAPELAEGKLYNTAAVLADERIAARYRKVELPNYGVFDEYRYFTPGSHGECIEVDGVRIGLSICEDIWVAGNPGSDCAEAGASLVVNISASPFQAGKGDLRRKMLSDRASEHDLPIAYCALVGGQDELVFDGESLVVDSDGELLIEGHQFQEQLILCDLALEARAASPSGRPPLAVLHTSLQEAPSDHTPEAMAPRLDEDEAVLEALTLGLADYSRKNRFNGVVLGVSGGIDSAVAAAIAVRALGADRVHGVVMPSPWSASETQSDARELCDSLGIERLEMPIVSAMEAYAQTLGSNIDGPGAGLAEENIQARIRGNLLMALSNAHGWLVLTTGNKSELAVGYSTLYGDAAGGFGVLKDVPKTLVYRLAELCKADPRTTIPKRIIDRPPSAELRPEQLDSDSLPPYDVLDPILDLYIEEHLDADAIVAAGFDRPTVDGVLKLIDRAEYKRRQYPPGVKITGRAFGRDRRMPITNRFTR
ncbi:MAG: NAD+ synthase [Solirubrobacterales bacterium]|nr:NAD+ synthase [Solirubrobacterales bacterium]